MRGVTRNDLPPFKITNFEDSVRALQEYDLSNPEVNDYLSVHGIYGPLQPEDIQIPKFPSLYEPLPIA